MDREQPGIKVVDSGGSAVEASNQTDKPKTDTEESSKPITLEMNKKVKKSRLLNPNILWIIFLKNLQKKIKILYN